MAPHPRFAERSVYKGERSLYSNYSVDDNFQLARPQNAKK